MRPPLPHEVAAEAPESAAAHGFALTLDAVLGISSLVGLAAAPFLYDWLRPGGASGGIDWSAAGSVSAPGLCSAVFAVIFGVRRRASEAAGARRRAQPRAYLPLMVLALALAAGVGVALAALVLWRP